MIHDNIKFSDLYLIQDDFKKVFDVLKTLDNNTPAGRIEINENAWVNVDTTPNAQGENFVFEAHKEFIDIHYMISGEEIFAYALCDNLKIEKDYNKEDDYMLLKGNGNKITLKEGDFVVVFPQDAHAPAIEFNQPHHRAVGKIKIK